MPSTEDEMVDVQVRLEPREDGYWVVIECEAKDACGEIGPFSYEDGAAAFKATVNREQSVTISGKEYPLFTH